MKVTMNYKLAMACGQDEADRNMKQGGRKAWNEEDYGIACATADRLWWDKIIEKEE